jgi:hypothetical protein
MEDSAKESSRVGQYEFESSGVGRGLPDWVDRINNPDKVIEYLNSIIKNYEDKKELVKDDQSMTNYYTGVIGYTKDYIKELESHLKRSDSQTGGRRRRKSRSRKSRRRKSRR